jgi:hypothetical protein
MTANSKNSLADEYLEEIEHRLRNTTGGPWMSFVEGRNHTSGSSFIRIGWL